MSALTQKVLLAIKKSFEYAYWDMKLYWISPEAQRNSTTVITLMCGVCYKQGLYFFCSLSEIVEAPHVADEANAVGYLKDYYQACRNTSMYLTHI